MLPTSICSFAFLSLSFGAGSGLHYGTLCKLSALGSKPMSTVIVVIAAAVEQQSREYDRYRMRGEMQWRRKRRRVYNLMQIIRLVTRIILFYRLFSGYSSKTIHYPRSGWLRSVKTPVHYWQDIRSAMINGEGREIVAN